MSVLLIEGYDGISASVSSYAVALEVAGTLFPRVEVILFPEEYVLLGRDVLNHFLVTLDGPRLVFDVTPSPS